MRKNQVRAIIKLLSRDKQLKDKPMLMQIFEQGGYLWASDGYVLLEIGEVKDKCAGKRITLEKLKEWNKAHGKNDILSLDLMEDNPHTMPNVANLVHGDYVRGEDLFFDVENLKIATDFLGIRSVKFEMKKDNKNLLKVVPGNERELDVLIGAMESKAYFMGLVK